MPSADSNISVIDRNTIVFNESFSQGVGTNGGGIFIGGTPPPVGGATHRQRQRAREQQPHPGQRGLGWRRRRHRADGLERLQCGPVQQRHREQRGRVRGRRHLAAGHRARGNVEIVHSTIANNDSLSTVGLAFTVPGNPNQSVPMAAGVFVRGGGNSPKITNSIVWHNRSYYYGQTSGGSQIPGATATYGLIACSTLPCSRRLLGYRALRQHQRAPDERHHHQRRRGSGLPQAVREHATGGTRISRPSLSPS